MAGTAPTLRRPPLQDPSLGGASGAFGNLKGNSFAEPPDSTQQPGGNAQALMNAAISTSQRPTTGGSGLTPQRNAPPQQSPTLSGPGSNQPNSHSGPTGPSVGGAGTGYATSSPKPPPAPTGGSGAPYGAPKPPAANTSGFNNPAAWKTWLSNPTNTQAFAKAMQGIGNAVFPNSYNIPLVPADEAAKAQAQSDFNAVSADELAAIQDAAMKYGDTGLMQQWGLNAAPNPNSTLALAALKAQQQQQAAQNNRERAGTFFSSLMGQDLSNIGNAQSRADLAGYQNYQTALANFNRIMNQGYNTWINKTNAANMDERQSALNTMPTAQGTGSGNFEGGSSTKVNSKVVGSSKTSTGGKGAKVKIPNPKLPKTSKPGKPGKTRVGATHSKVGGVKKAARVPGKRR